MQITIVGAGPAGLYAAILLKLARPDARLRVIEQNGPDDTFGFGAKKAKRRSEERRVGKECRIGCRSRWSPYH